MEPLYDRIGSTYARSRCAGQGIVQLLAHELQLDPASAYLDLACGTGSYTMALSALSGTWSAIDASEAMLTQARGKPSSVAWTQSNADLLPFADRAFDGAICTLAIHHFDGLEAPFAEVYRTLRAGSFVLFTGLAEQMQSYWLVHYFPEMMERAIANMPSESVVRKALTRAGFQTITVTPFFVSNQLQDLFLYAGKHRPQLYLEPSVRANMSSFARLTSAQELQVGLARLKADLQSGAFAAVKNRFATEMGDYAVVSARLGGCIADSF